MPYLLSYRRDQHQDHMDEVWEAIADPNTRVVAQVAPAVRVAVGDAFGWTRETVLWANW